ncbi:hypothetical protein JQ615_01060 [Bradyrhizobium jicamae]|uniref:Uncharacterized protein n=1 Tax=Bradyrhizobium jicamae TaxID=280332 RepID=A0ABS5FB11_9BRAD|nr:hypothetical protein [Bradyrhizobium jicamae]MBR0793970.1 hypothetical protein [Bradyrhizobium jicamae]
MKLLEASGWQKFDQEAGRVYPHLKKEHEDLREILKRFAALSAIREAKKNR